MTREDLLKLLDHIDPVRCSYNEWLNVGMALHYEGASAADWDAWSRKDPDRYKPGECYSKWTGFGRMSREDLCTGGKIFYLAKQHGWVPEREKQSGNLSDIRALEWNEEITPWIDPSFVKPQAVQEPDNIKPEQQLIDYLATLFEDDDIVGYVTSVYEKDGRFLPTKGVYSLTAGQLINELSTCNGDLESVLGDYNHEAGAWIRFNPLDGDGCGNANVTDFRFALVESDVLPIDQQHALIRELKLPVACLVHSGGKSLHAIVRINAKDKREYSERVNFLYDICEKNGLKIDTQNKNPSRLSRMPGIMRGENRQYLVDRNIGLPSWDEWKEYVLSLNDDLPDPENLADIWGHLPPVSPPLIEGVLRQGHKMLVAGPSKAGKSFLLIELAIAVAEGKTWLGWQCAQGKVLYINLEVDPASCFLRFEKVYNALKFEPKNLHNLMIWNLRGKSSTLDKLVPKLLRRSRKEGYILVIIDPIYKVITGDENSASEMAEFCNNFDLICAELNSAVVYCHHHSKGYQGGKRAMDRASGSGVFARDPDALLDMTELELTYAARKKLETANKSEAISKQLQAFDPDYYDGYVKEEDLLDASIMEHHLRSALGSEQLKIAQDAINKDLKEAGMKTAWRIEGTLREFPRFEPIDTWFDYPIHKADTTGILKDLDPEYEKAPWQKAINKRKDPEEKKLKRNTELEIAYANLKNDGAEITTSALAEEMNLSVRTVKRRVNEHKDFELFDQGDGLPLLVRRKND